MTYVKPSTKISTASGPQASSDSDVLVVDGKGTGNFGAPVQVSIAGYGVTGTDGTNTHEILDAMPMGRAATQNSIEAGNAAINFANEDYLTSGEITALADSNNHAATSDLT